MVLRLSFPFQDFVLLLWLFRMPFGPGLSRLRMRRHLRLARRGRWRGVECNLRVPNSRKFPGRQGCWDRDMTVPRCVGRPGQAVPRLPAASLSEPFCLGGEPQLFLFLTSKCLHQLENLGSNILVSLGPARKYFREQLLLYQFCSGFLRANVDHCSQPPIGHPLNIP
jgi:hypothetical protein